jgi:hypothetical protein
MAQIFHHLVAKTLYTTKRACPDTSTAIIFLTIRVREPDTDDWKKLSHLMRYLNGTKSLPLILSAHGSGIVKWYVDGSYRTHNNLRGHTGGGLTLGQGFPIVTSTKHKLNTRRCTESDLIGVDDSTPAICWTRYCFLEAQGYTSTFVTSLRRTISGKQTNRRVVSHRQYDWQFYDQTAPRTSFPKVQRSPHGCN